MTLIPRIESGEGEQRALLEEAYEVVFGNPPVHEYRQPNGRRGTRFIFMLNAEAYLSAAELLVPEGWSVKLYIHPEECYAEVYKLGSIIETSTGLIRPYAPGGMPHEGGPSPTPALALAAASLKAIDRGAE